MTPKTKTLYKFQDQADVDKWVHGSDAASGGLSTSNFDLAFDGARFHGNLSLRVKPEYEGIYRGGFAGIRTRARTSMFGKIYDNISMYNYIGVRARAGQAPNIRDAWYLNIRTASMSPSHVWQHRLFFRSRDSDFEELILPLDQFGYTAAGNMVESVDEMNKESVEMIGISLLGGNAGLQGPYDLVLDEIWATNDPDAPRNSLRR
ncbi:NADH:ubiquinone oxidoreductase complex I intermediate-associated protein 30 [Serendipita vermifera]|nr:NADH:ubiquinone oxidoreductase complex I intermediate-associated protein 30 [Serendipita vermifera]